MTQFTAANEALHKAREQWSKAVAEVDTLRAALGAKEAEVEATAEKLRVEKERGEALEADLAKSEGEKRVGEEKLKSAQEVAAQELADCKEEGVRALEEVNQEQNLKEHNLKDLQILEDSNTRR